MITLFCLVLVFTIFGGILKVALKASWALAKVFFTVILPPIALIVLIFAGLKKIALPVLIVIGVIVLLKTLFGDDEKKTAEASADEE